MYRFAILRHTMPVDASRPSHWDLLFEVGGSGLKTWAVNDAPDVATEQPATQLPDHRSLYLDFEGQIPNDRGKVRRWDWGTCVVLRQEARSWQFRLAGERLCGIARFTFDDDTWIYQFVAD